MVKSSKSNCPPGIWKRKLFYHLISIAFRKLLFNIVAAISFQRDISENNCIHLGSALLLLIYSLQLIDPFLFFVANFRSINEIEFFFFSFNIFDRTHSISWIDMIDSCRCSRHKSIKKKIFFSVNLYLSLSLHSNEWICKFRIYVIISQWLLAISNWQ